MPETLTDPVFPTETLAVEPWPDPVIDQLGHDPRSPYVERFWLAILGPSTVWLLRRLAEQFDESPEGFALDLPATARAIGVGMRGGKHSPFIRTLERTTRFGVARFQDAETLAVRRKIPPLTRGQVSRLPDALQEQHGEWLERSVEPSTGQRTERARLLALSLVELGEEREAVERQLHHWRFHPAVAHDAVRWALNQQLTAPPQRRPPTAPEAA